jgi:hypothetical protein
MLSAALLTFAEAGIVLTAVVIDDEPTARIYSIYPTTSVEVTVTGPLAVPSVPLVEGLTAIVAPIALIERDV